MEMNYYVLGRFEGYIPNENEFQLENFSPTWFNDAPFGDRGEPEDWTPTELAPFEQFGAWKPLVRSGLNEVPIAESQSVETPAGSSITIHLEFTDPDHGPGPYTITIASEASNGNLSGSGAEVIYTPAAGFIGQDSFEWKVNDGADDSLPATVTITIVPVPVAYYSFDENADDKSGNDNHGVSFGPGFVQGVSHSAFEFDGANDYVAVSGLRFKDAGEIGKMTLTAWIQTDFEGPSAFNNWAIVDYDRSEYFSFYVRGDNGRLGFSTSDSSGNIHDFYGNTPVNDGKWHHVAAVYDGEDKFLYVDGILDRKEMNPHGAKALGTGLIRFGFIGDGSEANAFNGNRNFIHYEGILDEVKFYLSDLSPADIQREFQQITLPDSSDGLLASYSFDGNAADRSSNENDAVVANGVFVEGIAGEALEFNGDNAYAAIQNLSFSNAGEFSSITICGWVKTDFTGNGRFSNWAILDFDRSEYFSLFIRSDTGTLGFSTTDSLGAIQDFYGTVPINDGLWHFVCAVYNGRDKILYVDGTEDRRTGNAHSGRQLGSGKKRFGFIGDGSEARGFNGARNNVYFDGALDELSLFNQALSRIEIQAMFQQFTLPTPLKLESKSSNAEPTGLTGLEALVLESNSWTLYEDAEDKTIDRWHVYNQGQVMNIEHGANNTERSIQTIGDIANDVFRLGTEDGSNWNNDKEFIAQFSVSLERSNSGAIYFEVETSTGIKYLVYSFESDASSHFLYNKNSEINEGAVSNFAVVYLGDLADGEWHQLERDLNHDLQSTFPNEELIQINNLFIYGSLKIDEVKLLDMD